MILVKERTELASYYSVFSKYEDMRLIERWVGLYWYILYIALTLDPEWTI